MKLFHLTFKTEFYTRICWSATSQFLFCSDIWNWFNMTYNTPYRIAIHDKVPCSKPEVQRKKIWLYPRTASEIGIRAPGLCNRLSYTVNCMLRRLESFRNLPKKGKAFWVTLEEVDSE